MLPLFAALIAAGCSPPTVRSQDDAAEPRIELVVDESARRVDVLVDGDPFTAYLFTEEFKKPTLHPIRTASGRAVTRGFPLDPQPRERVDHPHHIGLWLNYGNVNGIDFWNNSDAVSPERAPRMGTVVHRSIDAAENGYGSASLEVTAEWVDHMQVPLLRELTRYRFHAADGERAIDRITTLTALGTPIRFADNKEGMLGLRVARALEQPATSPIRLTDSRGMPEDSAILDNEGVTGRYASAQGKEGDGVWGTRASWTALHGEVEGEPVTLAILDHPSNVGFPTYWHARGYGLFAANPLGQREFSEGAETLDFRLAAGESVTFRHRILVLSEEFDAGRIADRFEAFSRDHVVAP